LIPMAGDSRKQQRSIYAGCDLGICSAKVVITDNGAILASETVPYKCFPHDAAEAAMEGALRRAGLPGGAVVPCLATGFGDKAVRFADGAAPNINCLLRGLRALNPQVRTVIDVGGHTLRVSNITSDGELYHTAFIEECAAATGLFIETEVVSYINEGYSRYDVFAGVTLGVAAKISSMARRIDIFPEVAMVGGVARNAAVKREVEQHLGLRFADLGGVDPQVVAAFGAALLAGEGYLAGAKQGRGGA
jgi:activator of 2-hydroxyglutaryl-CoA dehydratase